MGKVFESTIPESSYKAQIDDIRQEMHEKTEQGLRIFEMLTKKKDEATNLSNALGEAEQLLRKAQRSIMYDEIQEYFEKSKKIW
tara:strand:- start:110 stop:361 length:252 start_codon:yes stop_codon:yes gene_type:complete